jgi:exopolysaccharide/PEP-CTERM locus tyrosine autokinase
MGKFSKALEKSGLGSPGEEDQNSVVEPGPEAPAALEHAGSERAAKPGKKVRQPSGGWDSRLTQATSFSAESSESFRVLRSRILFPDDGAQTCKTIMVTSTAIGEGKTFVAANLGIALAQGVDQRSLLVDCDLRRPTLALLFGLPQQKGLADFLKSGTDLSGLILKTSVDKLTLLPSGRPPVNPSELLGSAKMDGLVREMAERYDDRFIIFDTPPVLAASEALVLSQKVDGVVLVVRQGASGRSQIKRIVELIGREKIIGIVFNGYVRSYLEDRVLGQYAYYGDYDKPAEPARG